MDAINLSETDHTFIMDFITRSDAIALDPEWISDIEVFRFEKDPWFIVSFVVSEETLWWKIHIDTVTYEDDFNREFPLNTTDHIAFAELFVASRKKIIT